METMVNTTQHSLASLEKYLRERDDIGKLIVHNLVPQLYNLLYLTRELQDASGSEQKASVGMAVNITEQLIKKVLNLHALAFDNSKLFVIGIFDLREVLEKLIKGDEKLSKTVSFAQGDGPQYQVGDAVVIRMWVNQVLQLLLDRFGDHPMNMRLLGSAGQFTIVVKMDNITPAGSLDHFEDTFSVINKLSALIDAQIAMEQTETSMSVELTMVTKEQ